MSDVIDLASPRVRIVRVIGDGMEPTLRPRLDFALCRPVHSYQGEGIYLLSDALGGETFYRVDASAAGSGCCSTTRCTEAAAARSPRPSSTARVLAIVLADIRGRVPVDRWETLR